MSSYFLTTWRARWKRASKHIVAWMKHTQSAILSMRTLVATLGILLTLLLFTAAITPVRYDISIGMVPTHTIAANRDVVDEITTETLRSNAAKAVQPSYHYVEGITESVLANFDSIFEQLDAAVQYSETLENREFTSSYTQEELNYAASIVTLIKLQPYQLRTLLHTKRADLNALYTTLYPVVQNAMVSNIKEGAESTARESMLQIVGYRVDTSLLLNVVKPLLEAVVQPNLLIDQEQTLKARQEARESIEPIVYKQGQNIVVKGEGRVERYQYEMLSTLGLLSNTNIDIALYLGASLLLCAILIVSLILLRLTDAEKAKNTKWLLLLFSVIILTLGLCILAHYINIYLSPVIMAAILLACTMGMQASIIFNASLALLVSALAAGGSSSYTAEMVQILACSLCSGTLAAMILSKRSNRLRVIGASVAAAICNFAIVLSLGLMTSISAASVLPNAFWCAGGAILAGLLSITAQPLLEAIFNLPTPTRLMELSNPNHPLLRRLLLEAPGTYHHSIVVANLAEAAAEAIGANPLLARVGGYYHDIGKLRRPSLFKENQLGSDNALVESDPYTAAQIVIAHTRDGALLARNFHLPQEIITMILEHHGNTPVMYFYTMAVKNANGQPVDAANFRYTAEPPATKEGAIVLLCDTIEAAVRSMTNPTPSTIEDFIVKLIRGKLQDGQLSNSPLTLKDIDAICHASATVLNGVFHERIEYPDLPDNVTPNKEHLEENEARPVAEELVKPWDGMLPDEIENAAAQYHQDDSGAPVLVNLSEFASQPLPVVDPPTSEAPLTIASALAQHAEAENEETQEDAQNDLASEDTPQ